MWRLIQRKLQIVLYLINFYFEEQFFPDESLATLHDKDNNRIIRY